MYGIWDYRGKRFVFGVKKQTPQEAIREFKRKAPGLWDKWRGYARYEAKQIPEGWKNKTNWLTKIENRARRNNGSM